MAYWRKKAALIIVSNKHDTASNALPKLNEKYKKGLKKQAKRYNKSYPGEMVHVDTKRLPLIKGQKATDKREYLFIAIDDF